MSKSKVYVVQNQYYKDKKLDKLVPKFDLTPAEEFGSIIYLLDSMVSMTNPQNIVDELMDRLSGYTSQDYLLLTGNPCFIGWSVAVASHYAKGDLNLLQWSPRHGTYRAIRSRLAFCKKTSYSKKPSNSKKTRHNKKQSHSKKLIRDSDGRKKRMGTDTSITYTVEVKGEDTDVEIEGTISDYYPPVYGTNAQPASGGEFTITAITSEGGTYGDLNHMIGELDNESLSNISDKAFDEVMS